MDTNERELKRDSKGVEEGLANTTYIPQNIVSECVRIRTTSDTKDACRLVNYNGNVKE